MFSLRSGLSLLVLAVLLPSAFAQRSEPARLLHPAPASNDLMGDAVAIDGDTLVVGVSLDDVNINNDQGSALVYHWNGSAWAYEATLTAGDGAIGDSFGSSVAIHRDTIVVGAPQDDFAGNLNQGGAYVSVRSGSTWSQQAKLTVPDGASADRFGWSVAVHDDTAVVGIPFDDVGANADQGSAAIFTRSGVSWSAGARIVASEGQPGDAFGTSVATEIDRVVVGAPSHGGDGAAFVFERAGSAWTEANLLSGEGNLGDSFGNAVAISGETIAVGAFADDVGANSNQGSVHVFTRSGTNWFHQAQITASDGALGDIFGCSVSLDGDRLLVGAYGDAGSAGASQGAAYVFVNHAGVWTEQAKLVDPDPLPNDWCGYAVALDGDVAVVGVPQSEDPDLGSVGSAVVFTRVDDRWIGGSEGAYAVDAATGDQLGASVAVSGDTVFAGASSDTVSVSGQGSAYVFRRAGPTLIQVARLVASDAAVGDGFGFAVDADGDTLVVGAPNDNNGAVADQGSAYVFVRSGSAWVQQAKLVAGDGLTREFFGCAVAISGDTIVVGADGDTVNGITDTGQVYVYQRTGTTWFLQQRLDASNGAAGDLFGDSVAIDGDTIVVGARWAGNTGAAYVFGRSGSWSQRAILSGPSAASQFGGSVAVSGDTILVGAEADSVAANDIQGSVLVYVRSGGSWLQQTRLVASDGRVPRAFGQRVTLDGNIAVIGTPLQTIDGVDQVGECYVFERVNSVWNQRGLLRARSRLPVDRFGLSVAIRGTTVVVGAPLADRGGIIGCGRVHLFDVPPSDYTYANINTSGVNFASLGAAVQSAATSQQIYATSGAFRAPGVVDTLGRTLLFRASGAVRSSSTAVLALAGGSGLVLPTGAGADFYGQIRANAGASCDVYADAFRLGSRGILTVRSGASLSISAPASSLEGQTRTESNSFLTFNGSADSFGPLTAAGGTTISASGTFSNFDTLAMTTGTISAPLTVNRAAVNLFGTCAVFGSYDNRAGAVTTIRSGTMYVYGSLTNNGTIVGTLCSNCLGGPPNMDIGGTLALGPGANLNMPFVGSVVRVGGNFDCAINSNARFDLSLATLEFDGIGAEQTLEVMSADIGAVPEGLDRSLAGHYPIGELHIGPGPSAVRIVDVHDNDNAGQSSCEALYVNVLRIDAGSRLANASCRIYYNELISSGSVEEPGNLIPIGPAFCPADFNRDGGVDSDDVIGFFAAWDNGLIEADFNRDDGVDSDDVIGFFANWDAGC